MKVDKKKLGRERDLSMNIPYEKTKSEDVTENF